MKKIINNAIFLIIICISIISCNKNSSKGRNVTLENPASAKNFIGKWKEGKDIYIFHPDSTLIIKSSRSYKAGWEVDANILYIRYYGFESQILNKSYHVLRVGEETFEVKYNLKSEPIKFKKIK